MKIMSIDYGDARTGIAFCDKNEILASAYTVINQSYAPKLINEITDIVNREKPELIVIGLPRNMDGSYGFRADACREFGELLSEKTGLQVVFQNERLTTVSAHNILNSADVRGKKRKAVVDAVSAVLILEDYLKTLK